MRRHDKARHIEKVNELLEQRNLNDDNMEKRMVNEVIKLIKTAMYKYEVTINNIRFKIIRDNYSYYKQYDLVAMYPDGSYDDYSDEHMPNLKTVIEFIKTIT